MFFFFLFLFGSCLTINMKITLNQLWEMRRFEIISHNAEENHVFKRFFSFFPLSFLQMGTAPHRLHNSGGSFWVICLMQWWTNECQWQITRLSSYQANTKEGKHQCCGVNWNMTGACWGWSWSIFLGKRQEGFDKKWSLEVIGLCVLGIRESQLFLGAVEMWDF